DVGRLSGAAQRRLGLRVLLEVRPDEAGGVRALGLDDAGIDRVDADLARTQLARQDAGNSVDGRLGGGVDGAVRGSDAAHRRTDVDHAGAFAEMLRGSLGG